VPITLLKMTLVPAIGVALSLFGTLTLRADPGVFDDRIVFGQSAALVDPPLPSVSECGRGYWRRSTRRTPLAGFMAASST
jgi:hypothetical protein